MKQKIAKNTFSGYVADSWEIRALTTDNNWTKLCYGGGRVVGLSSSGIGGLANRGFTTIDGYTVNATVFLSATDIQPISIAYSPSLQRFCAVGIGGNRVATSDNGGFLWTNRTASQLNAWRGICWSFFLNRFVAVAETGTNRVMTSPDGITWTNRTAPLQGWEEIISVEELGLLVAVGKTGTGNRVMTSPDGITWTNRSSTANVTWLGLAWSPKLRLMVAVSQTGEIMSSPDGINWTPRTTPPNVPELNSVCWASGLEMFVAVSQTGVTRISTSLDGINWTRRRHPEASSWRSVVYNEEKGYLMAVANGGTNRLMTTGGGLGSGLNLDTIP